MRVAIRSAALWLLVLLLAVLLLAIALNWTFIQRTFLGGLKVYETTPPVLPAQLKRPAILVFSKTNGFRHEEAIPVANSLFARAAKENGWGFFQTENGATFSPDILARFDAVVFNNVSGDVFRPEQRAALRSFVENGGGFVGIHGSGGDSSYAWNWYADHLIGARFIGHPLSPQFQQATVHVENRNHPATRHLGKTWVRTDEWYSFARAPRKPGYTILAVVDERTYKPGSFFGTDLKMGSDHPIAWWHCVGKGRTLYSAMGHQASAYAEPQYMEFLKGAVIWALRQDGDGCAATGPSTPGP